MRAVAQLTALAVIGAACASLPAAAQTPANLSTRDISDAERARDTMNRFAICVVRARPDRTREALAKTGYAESTAAMARLMKSECLAGGQLAMNPRDLRGALFRALYLREFGDDAEPLQFAPDSASPAASAPLESFGDCVLRAAPAATRVFVVAEVASNEEKQAIADLGPAMAGCVDPQAQLRFSPTSLEATLAEALYKRSVAASAAVAEERPE